MSESTVTDQTNKMGHAFKLSNRVQIHAGHFHGSVMIIVTKTVARRFNRLGIKSITQTRPTKTEQHWPRRK